MASEDISSSSLLQENSSSVVLDSSLAMNEEEVEATPEECKSREETNIVLNGAGRFDVTDSGDDLRHDQCIEGLTSELQYCGNNHDSSTNVAGDNSSYPQNASHTVEASSCVTLEMCHATPAEKSIVEHVNAIDFSLDSIDVNAQGAECNNSALERDWAPVTCGEVTSCETIQPCDREQPGTSAENHNMLYKQMVIDRNIIQDVEKQHNIEFFMGRALKTPERYMKIRNYILDMWQRTKPSFLFKTAVRGGLRNCGDVNSIGRVHAFLEDIGAINEGCLDRPVPRIRQQGEVTDSKENVHMESWVNSLRPRKKRPRNKDGDWVDNSNPEGMTIQVGAFFLFLTRF